MFEVRRSKAPNGSAHWRVVGFAHGKRVQRWSKSEKEAKEAAADLSAERLVHGTQLSLSPEDRLRAMDGVGRLAPHGKTLTDAVDFYLRHLERTARSAPMRVLTAKVRGEFRRRLDANETSKRYAESVEDALRKLETAFGERVVASITPLDIKDWLLGLPAATKTRNNLRGYAHRVFKYAVDFGYCQSNPVTGIEKFHQRASENQEIAVLTAEQTEKLLRAADPEVIPFLAIAFFAGVRRSTLERLDWKDVRYGDRRIVVPARKGKNQERYAVDIADNLAAWLAPHAREGGPLLAPSRAPQWFGKPSRRRTRELILKAARSAGIELPDNAGRHTFVSMFAEHHQDLGRTAKQANTSVAKIESNYLHLVSRADAARYWQIYPAPPQIVPFAA